MAGFVERQIAAEPNEKPIKKAAPSAAFLYPARVTAGLRPVNQMAFAFGSNHAWFRQGSKDRGRPLPRGLAHVARGWAWAQLQLRPEPWQFSQRQN